MVPVPELVTEVFFKPLSLNEKNPFHHITPYIILSNIPCSVTNHLPAFFQVGKVAREREIQAMYIPSLSSIAAAYIRKVVHYLAATIENLGGNTCLDRILTPKAVDKVAQYNYDLSIHEIKPIDMHVPNGNNEGNALAG
eukprot:6387678-Ditylum_brightwellii.AAC.1